MTEPTAADYAQVAAEIEAAGDPRNLFGKYLDHALGQERTQVDPTAQDPIIAVISGVKPAHAALIRALNPPTDDNPDPAA